MHIHTAWFSKWANEELGSKVFLIYTTDSECLIVIDDSVQFSGGFSRYLYDMFDY